MKTILALVVVGIAAYYIGDYHGYWRVENDWAASDADQKAQRIACWERDHNNEWCLKADAHASIQIFTY